MLACSQKRFCVNYEQISSSAGLSTGPKPQRCVPPSPEISLQLPFRNGGILFLQHDHMLFQQHFENPTIVFGEARYQQRFEGCKAVTAEVIPNIGREVSGQLDVLSHVTRRRVFLRD